jgi:ABC-type multidrug transport system fused ATPase/permease subunit
MGAADKVFELMKREPKRTLHEEAVACDLLQCGIEPESSEENDIEQQQSTENTVEDTRSSAHSQESCDGDTRIDANTSNGAQTFLSRLCHGSELKQHKVAEYFGQGLHPQESLSSSNGEITFHNVGARYPARPQRQVLDGLSLTIPAGSVVALVGSSGSGKSSIAKLIQNLYEPVSGQVCIDGVDVRHISPEWLTRHVSVVDQSCTLFARSVKRNITYGLEENNHFHNISDEEVYESARHANAHTFIEKLPHGYETEVGERGIQLSGGQVSTVAALELMSLFVFNKITQIFICILLTSHY